MLITANFYINCIVVIPQGSVFGPHLFLQFVNYYHNVSEHDKIKMFANDKFCLCSGTTTNEATYDIVITFKLFWQVF